MEEMDQVACLQAVGARGPHWRYGRIFVLLLQGLRSFGMRHCRKPILQHLVGRVYGIVYGEQSVCARSLLEMNMNNNAMKTFRLLPMLVLVVAATACQGSGKVKEIGEAEFRKKIYEFESGRVGPFKGSRPAIVDFYADWCKPCLAMAPVFDEIAEKYAGQIDVYRVDVVQEDSLALGLGIRQLPTLFFIPENGRTRIEVTALDRETLMGMADDLISQ